ncbi:hypothetical protein DVK05_03120 [Halorubrum sp. Atlit-8R]|uniref:hypothetical protein n=1 Tax=unclassified Halorubrum TaxID=2642239 RepID=UPI000EF26FDD|nr:MULTISPECIES: hypothetical protein [unclassified Halorubrum]RLM71053.1 hypothetical protein DVK08_02640 [Halorubrum sp. Atlit-9R]RLM71921.1 hypothetical protein DVK08_07385 [Halorubrum sp. Atlit-9R]RLM82794.1 hypothetical protein DVK05_03120 [Halorubrum sp. Atlit-8R]
MPRGAVRRQSRRPRDGLGGDARVSPDENRSPRGDRTDGEGAVSGSDDRWLHYGAVATPIDRPDRTFGYVDEAENPKFGTFPSDFLSRVDVPVDEERGRVPLGELDPDLYRRFGNGFQRVDVGALAGDLVAASLFPPHEARIVVLYGWFDMDRKTTAEALETEPDRVRRLVETVRDRRERADRTATVRFTPE